MKLTEINDRIMAGNPISQDEAVKLTTLEGADLFDLFALANRLRERHSGAAIKLCAIINAKSGRCPEDCSFCAQSAHHNTNVESWPLVGTNRIVECANAAKAAGAVEFSIVTSGYGVEKDDEVAGVERGIRAICDVANMRACASPGIVSRDVLARFKEAGLGYYHHNLETARSFFPNVCTTHDYSEDVDAARSAKSMGLKVCCGGIFGLGESWEQRVELLMTLRELDVDSIPINFLNPIPGTPMEGHHNLTPMDCLKIITIARVTLPDKDIIICGGREVNLRDLQGMMFFAGANGALTGNYLTTAGRAPDEDLRLIKDAGLEAVK